MANNYVSNGPISVPLYVPNLKADVDLGGLKFSYQHGMFYTPTSTELSLKLPPPFDVRSR